MAINPLRRVDVHMHIIFCVTMYVTFMQKQGLERLIRKDVIESISWKPPVGRRPFIRLDLNEGHGFINKAILKQLKNIDEFTLVSYPEYEDMHSAVAAYCDMRLENICLTSGSDHAIQMLLNLFFTAGDHVVIPAPTFFVYFSTLKLVGVQPDVILYKNGTDTFVFPYKETLKAITPKTKGLLLCNPDNPLGCSIPRDELIELIKKCHGYKIPVIIDEAYAEFSGYTATDLISTYDNVIILRTFSKAFGLAGIRLGYVIAAPSVIEQLIKLRLPWAVNHFAVHAGMVALKNLPHFKKELENTIERRKRLSIIIKNKGVDRNMSCYDTDTNFIVIKSDEHEKFIDYLKKNDILVNDISHYPHSGRLVEKCLRMGIPSKKDYPAVEKAIDTFLSGVGV
jgi:histidinol-phosphate aminotransferase